MPLDIPPTVSVVIPCYDQGHYLGEAVESVVGQTFTGWEIVIVDDGSADATASVAQALIEAHRDQRIRLIRQANTGTPRARNAGITASTGRYILALDADDVLLPSMLEMAVGLLEARPDVAIAYTDYRKFGTETGLVATGPFTVDDLAYACQLSGTTLYRREVWSTVGGYNPNMRRGYEDWDFWISAAEHGFVGRRIPEPLWLYRKSATSRNVEAIQVEPELLDQIARNHPDLYTPGRRARHRIRRARETLTRVAKHAVKGVYRRITGRELRRAR